MSFIKRLFSKKSPNEKLAAAAKTTGTQSKDTTEGPLIGRPMPKNYEVLEKYSLTPPFAYAMITQEPTQMLPYYFVDELELTQAELELYNNILSVLRTELAAPRDDVDPKKYFAEQAKLISERYKLTQGKNVMVSWAKILYYAERDLVGFGMLDALMRDPNIEDISVDGTGKSVFVYHRKFESIVTNLTFAIEE